MYQGVIGYYSAISDMFQAISSSVSLAFSFQQL